MATSTIKTPMRIDYSSGISVAASTDISITTNKVLIGTLLSNQTAYARVVVDGNTIVEARGTDSSWNIVFPVFIPLYPGQTLRLSPSDTHASFQCKLYDVIGE